MVWASLFPLAAWMLSPAEQSESSWQVVGQIGGATQAVAVQGNHAYVGVGVRLEVLNVSNPHTPTAVGATAPFPHFVQDIVIRGTTAYVAAGGAGLRVVDISDPTHPVEVGAWDSLGYAEGVAVSGSTVYLADGPYGLWTVDVSDPAHPRKVGSAYDMNYAFEVVVSGHYAYIAAAGAGLLVADVSDPAHPLEVGTLDTPGYAYGITVSGTLAYVADGWEGVRLVDVSNPISPTAVSAYQTPGWAFGVTISGTRAYVADAFAGLRVLDVSDPEQPTELGGYEVAGGHAGNVAVAGNVAYVADRNHGLWVISVADAAHPVQVGSYAPLGFARDVALAGDYAYVAGLDQGLRVIDVSDPAHPLQVGSYDPQDQYDPQNQAACVLAEGGYVYLSIFSSGGGGLHVMDFTDPAHPVRIGYIDQPALYMDITGGIAYLTNEWGLVLVSVADPSHPALLGAIQLQHDNTSTGSIAVNGTRAYVTNQHAGLEIVDVSNPLSPTLVGNYDDTSYTVGVAVVGNTAYLADCGLRILDVSDPTRPIVLGHYYTQEGYRYVVVEGNTAYVAAGSAGVSILDVPDSSNPTLLARLDTLGEAFGLAVASGRIFVADGPNGLLILEQAGDATRSQDAEWPRLQNLAGQPAAPAQPDFAWPEALGVRRTDPPGSPRQSLAPQFPRQPPAPQRDIQPAGDRAAATCVVTSPADSGTGTLRACLENAVSGDTITFDSRVFSPTSPVTIPLISPLPWFVQGHLTVDASNAGVILDGSHAPGATGLVITSDGNVVRGLQIVHFAGDGIAIIEGAKDNLIGGDRSVGSGPLGQGNRISGIGFSGVSISGAGTVSNTVAGNLIGVNLSGTALDENDCCVSIGDGASHNIVGGDTPGESNVIGGREGINIYGPATERNLVQGNRIGTDASGTMSLRLLPPESGYFEGVLVNVGAHHNIIGPGNVVNSYYWGIALRDPGTADNVVIGNQIGTNITGTAAIGNYDVGVLLANGAQRNRIGGATPLERNLVSGNTQAGIKIVGAEAMNNRITGNYVGTDASGMLALGNQRGAGIEIWSPNNIIGGYLPGEGNLASGNRGNGIGMVYGHAYGNLIAGNYTGTDASGTADLGNGGHGISMEGGAHNNRVEGNLSSGNVRCGVLSGDKGSDYNVIVGNRIGTDVSGTHAIPNDWLGVGIGWDGSFNRVGGTAPGEGNLISGNNSGIEVEGGVGNLLLGNWIGTDASGMRGVANANIGVNLGAASGTLFGGATPAERNVVSGNFWGGVVILSDYNYVAGNWIGTDVTGAAPLGNQRFGLNIWRGGHNVIQGNRIAYTEFLPPQGDGMGIWVMSSLYNTLRRNFIYSNVMGGIELTEGGNNLLAAPVIITVTASGISGTTCPGCIVEVFSDAEDEGRIFEGYTAADVSGIFVFDKGSLLVGPHVTATATDSEGNTSGFSIPQVGWRRVYLPVVLRSP